jgi:hypothetical protein
MASSLLLQIRIFEMLKTLEPWNPIYALLLLSAWSRRDYKSTTMLVIFHAFLRLHSSHQNIIMLLWYWYWSCHMITCCKRVESLYIIALVRKNVWKWYTQGGLALKRPRRYEADDQYRLGISRWFELHNFCISEKRVDLETPTPTRGLQKNFRIWKSVLKYGDIIMMLFLVCVL